MTTDDVILVTGASGFLGEHVTRLLEPTRRVVGVVGAKSIADFGASVRSVDLTDPTATAALVDDVRPSAIIHAAAWTDIARCEKEPVEARRQIVLATENLLSAAEQLRTPPVFVHVSTDQVFDGRQPIGSRYRESDEARPISAYGRWKLEAEHACARLPTACIVRTALLYGRATTHRQSFVGWIRSTWERGEKTPLFVDEIRTPVDVEDLARALVQLADRRVSGLWHAGGDVLSRQAMGEILADVWGVGRDLIQPTRLADSSYPAPRPAQVALDASSLETRLGWKFRSFRQAVSEQQGRWTMNT